MSDQSLREALEQICDDYSAIDVEMLRETLAAHPAEPAPVVTDEPRAVFPDASEVAPLVPRFGVVRCGVCGEPLQKMDRDSYGCPACAPLGPRSLLDEIAVRNKIAEWYGAEWDAHDSKFYETDDGGRTFDEDEDAMHAYRGFKWAQEMARPMPTREQIEAAVRKTIFTQFGTFTGTVKVITDDVTALLNGAES